MGSFAEGDATRTIAMPVKILVVEDDFYLMEGIKDILELDGYQVLTAGSGNNALDVLRKQKELPDLIVSDIMMPGMDGYDLLREVRGKALWNKIPFIFLTAKGERSDANKGKELGADDYVTKPFGPDDLRIAVSSKLERHRQLRQQHESEILNLKQRILEMLYHEFRTPLTYVVAYNEMLKQDADALSAETLRRYLVGIDEGASRLRRLVENFIMLVEIETGEAVDAFNLHRIIIKDYATLLAEVTDPFRMRLDATRQSLKVEVDPDTPPTQIYHDHFVKALQALVDNALKFGRDRDYFGKDQAFNQVVVRVMPMLVGDGEQAQECVCFEISDTGRGIAPEEVAKIFDVFYQINRKEFEDQGGGVGLAIVKGIVQAHNGEVVVDSTPGSGTSVLVLLPAQRN